MLIGPGTRLGPYEVTALIGEGGMGKVWRAHHTALKRDDALKVLPDAFASDPERLARFRREAQVLASLNHPNIAHVYGLEQSDGVQALVMELVEGPTLADRIAQGPIPVDEALPIAKQIAEALEAAHEQGIIHRDLKPANIKLRPDGMVKVLDFGLAKALEPTPGVGVDATASPTITSPAMMTGVGVLLGTAAYMSPEQARGKAVDKRSDIWAFGCVLYEMLTGRRAFDGEDVSDTLANVLKSEPDWTAVPASVSPAVQTLIRASLQKDRRRRLAGSAGVLFVLEHHVTLESAPGVRNGERAPATLAWRKAAPVIGAALVAAIAAGYAMWAMRREPAGPVSRFRIVLPADEQFGRVGRQLLALSPDGAQLAYVTAGRLHLHPFNQLDPAPIRGIEGSGINAPASPFFSPDGDWIGFWQSGQLKKVSVMGGPSVTLADAAGAPPFGASWSDDDTLLFSTGAGGIWRVSANGGTPERIVEVDAGRLAHGPQMLPDGQTVLFTQSTGGANWDEADIVAYSLETGSRNALVRGGHDGRYLPTGHIVYVLRNTLFAVPFDVASLRVRGAPVPLVEGVATGVGGLGGGGATTGAAHFSISANGTLAYVSGIVGAFATNRTLVWVDRQGEEDPVKLPPQFYNYPRLSPDGTRVAVDLVRQGNRDIWVGDLARGTLTRVTTDPTIDRVPLWMPGGQTLVFSSDREGGSNLYRQAANGTGQAERLTEGKEFHFPHTTSPDGKWLVFRQSGPGQGVGGLGVDLMMLTFEGAGPPRAGAQTPVKPTPLVQTSFIEDNAVISPDGRWLAYEADTSGEREIYVRPFPHVGAGQWRVSVDGGSEPLWARGGRELFYRAPSGAVMGVPVNAQEQWSADTPAQLVGPGYIFGLGSPNPFRSYDVSRDGHQFLMLKEAEAMDKSAVAPPIILVNNWFEELKRLVPVN